MIIVGEKLNSSIPKTLEALNHNDKNYLIELIKTQFEAGANYLYINTTLCVDDELTKMLELVNLVYEYSGCGIMIESTSSEIIKAAVCAAKRRPVIINSLSLTGNTEELLPILKETGASIVALPIDQDGIPNTLYHRIGNAKQLIDQLLEFGISPSKIYMDVLADSVATSSDNAMLALHTIWEIKKLFPQIKTICRLSQVSFGLPEPDHINTAFLAMAAAYRLDSIIMDITSPCMQTALYASLCVAGKDDYCMNYVGHIEDLTF